jgi:HEAT repeat protein
MPLFGFGKPSVEKLKAKQDVNGLVKMLFRGEPVVRKDAVRALGEIGDIKGIEGLSNILNDPDKEMLELALHSLLEINQKHPESNALKVVISALNDNSETIRLCAAQAIYVAQGLDPLECYNKALKKNPDNRTVLKLKTSYLHTRARALHLQCMEHFTFDKKAILCLNELLTLDPNDQEARFWLEQLNRLKDYIKVEKENAPARIKQAKAIEKQEERKREELSLFIRPLISELISIGSIEHFFDNEKGKARWVHPRAYEIGEILNAKGSKELMQSVWYTVERSLGALKAEELSICWHEIGQWRH